MFFGNTLLTILHLEIAKNLFAAGSCEQLAPGHSCLAWQRIFSRRNFVRSIVSVKLRSNVDV